MDKISIVMDSKYASRAYIRNTEDWANHIISKNTCIPMKDIYEALGIDCPFVEGMMTVTKMEKWEIKECQNDSVLVICPVQWDYAWNTRWNASTNSR